uniref:Putative secreted protein n=1 Tax=Ixodes ricinus TaxID=34613 RepID=A0A6B0U2G3_IXORI
MASGQACTFFTNCCRASCLWFGLTLVWPAMSFMILKSLRISSVRPVRTHSSGTRHTRRGSSPSGASLLGLSL